MNKSNDNSQDRILGNTNKDEFDFEFSFDNNENINDPLLKTKELNMNEFKMINIDTEKSNISSENTIQRDNDLIHKRKKLLFSNENKDIN